MAINSLYECTVAHCRLKPKRNEFKYRVFMFCVDLNELQNVSRKVLGFSHNRFNFYSIDDRDHVDLGQGGGIRGNLIEWLSTQRFTCPPDAQIRLVRRPRVFGYGFNPVSFYYIDSASGKPLAAVAEVTNTFREMKLYLIQGGGRGGQWCSRVAKNFYVSPFSDPGLEFDFRLGLPSKSWGVNIDDYDGKERVLLSSVRGKSRELTSARLMWYLFKYPLLSLKIIGLIHWQALLLWIRRVPVVRKSERREVQIDVMRPKIEPIKNTL